MSTIRVRIAPSPTGPLHIGTARTALFNYLFAKKYGGKFILRIEDTDLERSDAKFEKDIFEGLKWLGIDTDESPEIGGPYKPYRQSERIESYKKYIEKLFAENKAFYCFHSEEELEEEKEKLLTAKLPSLHMCEFRTLDQKEAKALAETKTDYIIRFKTPVARMIVFKDIIRGELSFNSEILGDFSIAKNSYTPLYNFAVVVDDQEMQISHVIRGEDHIANTPKQLLLIEALGFKKPEYAHLPLILGPDRSKLSKRHGATSVNEYRKQGYLPEALFNFMALLGWNPGDNREIFSKKELSSEFSLENVQKSGAIFDTTKLDWMNGEYIRKLTTEKLFDQARDFLPKNFQQFSKEYIYKMLELEKPRLKKLSEIEERIDYFFGMPEYDKEMLQWKNMNNEEILISLDKSYNIISNFSFEFSKEKLQQKFFDYIGTSDKGKLLWPLRVALSGKKASPGPFEILEILGQKMALERLLIAKEKIK